MTDIDLDLYSRQIGALGLEAMAQLTRLKILICGLQGAGVELAKNLILAGPECVTLLDDSLSHVADQASNFFLADADIGVKTRSESCVGRLQALNPNVTVKVTTGALVPDLIAAHHVVVLCNVVKSQMIRVNTICRSCVPQVGCICVGVYGLAASVFVDFGDRFEVKDTDGNPVVSHIIDCLTETGDGYLEVHCSQDSRKPFEIQPGDIVSFSGVLGCDAINSLSGISVRSVQAGGGILLLDVKWNSVPNLNSCLRGGFITVAKKPKTLHFKSFESAITHPVVEGSSELMTPDLAKIGRPEQLHIAIHSLLEYEELHHCIPEIRDSSAADECVRIANTRLKSQMEFPHKIETVDEDVVRNVANFAACQISPMAAIIGGYAAQEVLKWIGKFTPTHQWFHFDAFELLEGNNSQTNDFLCTSPPSRYDDQIYLWGNNAQKKLAKAKVFVVGAGALGCEYLKNLALLGIAQRPQNGELTVTDMDHIEVSNLNRQFLFKRQHVGQSKSLVAASVAKGMNSGLNVRALEEKVGEETEDVFDDEFWDGLDIVVNALDNLPSRLYVDSKCVWHGKPLIEAGTLGPKGNVQVVLPRMTESYGDSRDPPEDSIPLCTLKHFPNQIEHAIEWARDTFEGLFTDSVQELRAFLEGPDAYINSLRQDRGSQLSSEKLARMRHLLEILIAEQEAPDTGYTKCVQLAEEFFMENFEDAPARLLRSFPLDHVTSSGVPFWGGPKRPPVPLPLDVNDELHVRMITYCANLFAISVGLTFLGQPEKVKNLLCATSRLRPTTSKPPIEIKIDETGKEVEETTGSGQIVAFDDVLQGLNQLKTLAAKLKSKVSLTPHTFEKDDDTNFHVDFVWACSNLRARNYRIEETTRLNCKLIAGRIIPAMATTTGLIAGLATLELLKYLIRPDRPLSHYKDAFVNLALPFWVLSEPREAKKNSDKDYDPIAGGPVKSFPKGFTTWDKIQISLPPSSTLNDFVKRLEEYCNNAEVIILAAGDRCVYNKFSAAQAKRLEEPFEQLVASAHKKPRKYAILQASCTDSEGVDLNLPPIQAIYRI